MKTVWITVYKDTIKRHNDDWNLSDIQVTEEFLKQYFNECKVDSDCEWKTYEEFMDNYTVDDTEDLYEYAKKHDAIIKIEHMEDLDMTLQKFFEEIDNDNYIILDGKGNERELTSLIAMSDVIQINIYYETVYITVR